MENLENTGKIPHNQAITDGDIWGIWFEEFL